jgi:hypothetical protein
MGTLYIPAGLIKSGRILAPLGGVDVDVVFETPYTEDTMGTDGDYHIDIKAYDALDKPLPIGYRLKTKSLAGFTIVPDFDASYITWETVPFTE